MTLAIVLVIAAVLSLTVILWLALPGGLQRSSGASLPGQVQLIDIAAFRNLIDPAEDAYLRHRLPAPEFRVVRRERLRAMAAYVQTARRNAAILIVMGQSAAAASDAHTAEAARQLVNDGLLLRSNTTVAIFRIYIAMAWPNSDLAAAPVLSGYERLSGSAMLLGRLQNPAVPVRIAAGM
jgi:hypothetical protein